MIALLALPLLLLAATPVAAQPRDFNCVGAEQLDDDTYAVTFPSRADRLGEEARSAIAAAVELAKREERRNICVLGHALATEGGAQTGQRLAARRARAVADALSSAGIERDRVRAEARVAGFTRSTAARRARGATIIILP
ncbi:hypothetical protein EOD42_05875 [Rhodovarius crocodyli]|uniref:OmpA-like domain-containing protein n=1 Tax=Rhodovarius crocodyli TaxID=1979269 RepID=A0A437MPP1_9PROT|nr:OmpA family protein [Rhodovarius crocodyli]RVT99606.1 hypothetical protein EOD42_05875 [Rhodovarius crocodyli]